MTAIVLALILQETREILHSDRPVEVRVAVSDERKNRATVVTFPEASLEALVAGWNESDLSLERQRGSLFIKLLRPAEGDLHVLGASGRLYRLAIRPAEDAYDGRVKIRLPETVEHREPHPIGLLRAMRLGRRFREGHVLRSDAPVFRSDRIDASLVTIYETPSFRGYVVRVESNAQESVRLDPSRFVGRGLLLAGAREMLLKPGDTTRLYLVFRKEP